MGVRILHGVRSRRLLRDLFLSEESDSGEITGKLHNNLRAPLITDSPYFYIALTVMVIGTFFFLTGFLGELVNRNSAERNSYLIRDKINL
jgi:hypothetical protein